VTGPLLPPDPPVAILAAGAGGAALHRRLAGRLPHEDFVLLVDNAYAPYARRQPRVVANRVGLMVDELLAHGPKLVLLASAQATADAVDVARRRCTMPVLAMERMLPVAAVAAGGLPVAVVTGADCTRGLQHARQLRRQRGGVGAVPAHWPGLAHAVDVHGAASPQVREIAAAGLAALDGVRGVLLACSHAGAASAAVREEAPQDLAVVDGLDVLADRAVHMLRQSRALARRKRRGRVVLIGTDPARGQRVMLG
jgi:glutamate racemase